MSDEKLKVNDKFYYDNPEGADEESDNLCKMGYSTTIWHDMYRQEWVVTITSVPEARE